MTKDRLEAGQNGDLNSSDWSKIPTRRIPKETFEPPPLIDAMCAYFSYLILFIFGHLADFFRRIGLKRDFVTANLVGLLII